MGRFWVGGRFLGRELMVVVGWWCHGDGVDAGLVLKVDGDDGGLVGIVGMVMLVGMGMVVIVVMVAGGG